MEVDYGKTVEKLAELVVNKDLGEDLFNQVTKCWEILESKNTTPEQKHDANILAEYIIGKSDLIPNLRRPRR